MPDSALPAVDLEVAAALVRDGQITAALRLLERPLPPDDDPDRTARALTLVVECRLARGDLRGAARAADQLVGLTTRRGTTEALAAFTLGELATARGEHESALARYTAAGELLGPDGEEPALVPWRSAAALALTRLGRHREARRMALAHLALARASGPPYAVAQALRTLAATDGVGPAKLLREARSILGPLTAKRLAAQIDADLAVLLSLHLDPAGRAEAIELLRGAESVAEQEELFPLQDRVRRQLEWLGQRPRRIRSESVASLTRTEQKTARLAADGLTNREIATALRVTVKAVEWHLSHVYRKLGIRSRGALAETLGVAV